ncbi:MAG TPA: ParB/RepB/Spo0J family partition protein [Candidatus Woesebacteria bacterium]|nr:ParB/RepB/Spo0J family partition protein [Candidatus Woesebacteria bacterium]HRS22966.1 ParB/RepB/Spo0J family partition protein [Candidatus Woesebacteria bacterium]HRT40127.1 ParB/RepB/Spo0J family partition protein [Candidatus Woesebacteria bacterium]
MKSVQYIAVDQLEPNPMQPRGPIDSESIGELMESIREHGILEPLIVAQTPAGYQIIAGECRWRAAKALKLKSVPVIIKETTPRQMLEMSIVENLQRIDLNPIERAKAFLRLKEEFGFDHHQIAAKVGKSVPYVINELKLLNLPDALKDGLLSGLITEGHARALISIGDTRLMIEAYKIVLKEKASVRRTEDIARRMRKKIEEGKIPITKENLPYFLKSKLDKVSNRLESFFKDQTSKVKIIQSNAQTRVIFQFKGSLDDRSEKLKKLYRAILKTDPWY